MKAKKIWIATHNTQPYNREVSFDEPHTSDTLIYSDTHDEDDTWSKWKEYLLIELET